MAFRPLEDWKQVGDQVSQAREDAGLTQEDLARQIGLERTALAKVEKGRRGLSSLELARLAESLGRSIQWFVTASPPAVVSRRASQLKPPNAIDLLVESFARDVELLIELKALKPRKLTPDPVPQSHDEAESLAAAARKRARVPAGPLDNLLAVADRLGLYAAVADESTELPDGAYVAIEGAGAAVINGGHDSGRRRFTLAHELGHHLTADEYSTDTDIAESRDEREKLINTFAIHFLMPRASIKGAWHKYAEDHDPRAAAIRIAADYRVSWSAACTQLATLGLIDRELDSQLRAEPPRKADYIELDVYIVEDLQPPSISPTFAKAVIRAYRAGKLNADRAAELARGTMSAEDLPGPAHVPLAALRGEVQGPV